MFNGKKSLLAFVVAGAFVATAQAGESAAEQIKQINENIAVLSAQVAELEQREKIANKKEAIRKLESGGLPAAGAGSFMSSYGDDVPTVRAIDGVDGKLKATLAMRNGGGVQTVSEGEKFGVWMVKRISVSTVALARGKETIKLNFGTESAAPSATSYPGSPIGSAGPGLPVFPGANQFGK